MDCASRLQQHLLLFRRLLGWSAEDLGEKIGVTRQTINNVESCRSKLTKPLYIALRKVIDEEIVMYPDETKMLSILLYILIDHPDELKGPEIDKAVTKANLMAPSIISGTATRGKVSDEWVSDNENILNDMIIKEVEKVDTVVFNRIDMSELMNAEIDDIRYKYQFINDIMTHAGKYFDKENNDKVKVYLKDRNNQQLLVGDLGEMIDIVTNKEYIEITAYVNKYQGLGIIFWNYGRKVVHIGRRDPKQFTEEAERVDGFIKYLNKIYS